MGVVAVMLADPKRHAAAQVIKQNNNVCWTHKAYNGRILCQYFADVSVVACAGTIGNLAASRKFGKWLHGQITGGFCEYPAHEMLIHQADCMRLDSISWHSVWQPFTTMCRCLVAEPCFFSCASVKFSRRQGQQLQGGFPWWRDVDGICALDKTR